MIEGEATLECSAQGSKGSKRKEIRYSGRKDFNKKEPDTAKESKPSLKGEREVRLG